MKYELTFLLNEESELPNIKDLVANTGGKLVEEQAWGQKTLSYPIKKQHTAHYFNWVLDLPQSKVNELRKKLNFNEKIMRYLLLISEK